MTQIIWLASYPRSGNTWMRFLIHNLYHGAPFASREVDNFIPSFHNGVGAHHFRGRESTIVKTHLRYDRDMPLADVTTGAIYVYRHPYPVMASNVRYVMRRFPYEDMTFEERAGFVRQIVDEFVEHRGLVGWHRDGYGSWSENLRSWLDVGGRFPVLALRYEDVTRDPFATVDRICTFLKIDPSPAARAAAIENTSEAALMAMEERELRHKWPGLFNNLIRGGSRNWRFVRDRSLEPLAELVPERLARAAEVLGAEARQFGYD